MPGEIPISHTLFVLERKQTAITSLAFLLKHQQITFVEVILKYIFLPSGLGMLREDPSHELGCGDGDFTQLEQLSALGFGI